MTLPANYRLGHLRLLPGHAVLALAGDSSNAAGFTSSDGGLTWRRFTVPPSPMRYGDLSFADDSHWWATRYGLVFQTSDAGQTWQKVNGMPLLEDWHYQTAHVIDSRHDWWLMISTARGNDSALAMTSDGGVHWTPVNVPRPG